MSHGDTISLHHSSQSDIDEIERLIYDSVLASSATVPQVPPASPPRASIPISSSTFINSNAPPPPYHKPMASTPPTRPVVPAFVAASSPPMGISSDAFGTPPNTLIEPVWDTVKRDLSLIVRNLKLVVFPNPYREDPGKALRDWDLWGPFFFIVFLGLVLSWSASVKKSEVFAVAFAILAAGAVILTLNVLLLGGHINFFQSLSLLGYCLFPLDVGALICLLSGSVFLKWIVASVTLAWSSWTAYPFMSAAVSPRRKALALYPVFLILTPKTKCASHDNAKQLRRINWAYSRVRSRPRHGTARRPKALDEDSGRSPFRPLRLQLVEKGSPNAPVNSTIHCLLSNSKKNRSLL
ncbi:hypothetical protein HPP92_003207 [Vanilla planifolia]|uniref:Protein YIP n=1 Tax=Vanilla planifolia TaxID=51239 RepID=A0A835RUG0_VANPL|nr:hypothetical protein HPP92_003207 [Vanilla planifolia]